MLTERNLRTQKGTFFTIRKDSVSIIIFSLSFDIKVTPNVPSRPTQETSVIPVDNKVENQGNVIEANAPVDGTDSTSPQGNNSALFFQ